MSRNPARRSAILGLSLLTAACATPQASITFGDPENPGRVTAVSGLSSRDAAHVANTQAFYSAKAAEEPRAILRIKAQPGQKVTIDGLEELVVNAPTTSSLPDAPQAAGPTEFSENLRAAGQFVRDVGSVAVPFKALDATADVLKRAAEPTVVQTEPLVVDPVIVNPLVVRP
jgi:hypothetical protein